MALTTAQRFGDAMPQSGNIEAQRIAALTARGWVLSTPTLGANATQVSSIAYKTLVNGVLLDIAASGGTALWVTGIGSIATGATGLFVVTVTVSGTHKGYVATVGTTLNAIGMPTVAAPSLPSATIPATEIPIGFIVVACTAATAFNGGTNSLADASYTVTAISHLGPSALTLATENFTIVPG